MGGDGCADFEGWYRREHPRLVASLLLVAGDLDAARDAADEAFARAIASWDRVGRMESINGWTYRVALNVFRRKARRAAIERRVLARTTVPAVVPPPAGEAWAAVRQLPMRQRTAVVLRFVGDLTEEQVGVAMGVSRSTVASALADARKTLGRLLEDEPTIEVPCA